MFVSSFPLVTSLQSGLNVSPFIKAPVSLQDERHMTAYDVIVEEIIAPNVPFNRCRSRLLVIPRTGLSFLKVFVPLHTPSFPSFPPPSSGVRLAGRHLSRWGVVGQVTFVCHCFAPHTSPREQGRSLAYSTCHRLHRRPARYRRSAGELDVPTESRETLRRSRWSEWPSL